ncbi:MAG: PKD domain-containing protein, partial [Bacteroidota bacterium]
MKGLYQWFLVLCLMFGLFIQLNAQPGACEAGFSITAQTGLTIQFNNLSDYVNGNGNFPPVSWDFGDNNTSTDYNPTHTYANPGVYQVCVLAYDAIDCEDTFCDNVYVGTIDCDDFIVDVNHSGLDIFASIFDPSNSGPSVPDAVEWYLPGTNTVIGNQPNLTYTFPSGGLQTICVNY